MDWSGSDHAESFGLFRQKMEMYLEDKNHRSRSPSPENLPRAGWWGITPPKRQWAKNGRQEETQWTVEIFRIPPEAERKFPNTSLATDAV